MIKELTYTDYANIKAIAEDASTNPELQYSRCYNLTLFYYLVQYKLLKLTAVPHEYEPTVKLLVKNPKSSYIHYINDIKYSKNKYAIAIKNAEIKQLGDDPRCPW